MAMGKTPGRRFTQFAPISMEGVRKPKVPG